MTYNRDDALKISKDYFDGDDLAAGVFVSKYALKDAEGTIYEASPAEMHKRLATEFARIENKYPNPMQYDEIYQLLSNWDVVPQGSPMSAIGNPYQLQSLSNCFVIESPHDSYGGILKTDEEQAQIMKRRGGVGFDISTIRPKGLVTTNAAKTTDGIGVFMERFSNTCREVAQGGRRGALMLSLSINHPEIRTFLNIKKDLKKVTGANISIRLSDEFMLAVKNDLKFKLRFPVDKSEPALVEDWVEAKQLWNEIIEAAHQSAEPGLLFWDTMIRRSPADSYASYGFKTTSTNPCLTADTMVAVADGREFVEIGQLAKEGLDVLVYALDENGKIVVKTMRNPRLTGKNEPIYELTLENGHKIRATKNHKFMTIKGEYKEICDLSVGDALYIEVQQHNTELFIQHYEFKNIDGILYVKKICEHCGNEFWVPYSNREISFCQDCAQKIDNKCEKIILQSNFAIKIVDIRFVGHEDVYNGTVDDVHNFYVGGWNENGQKLMINNKQCGELPNCPEDSCRLLLVNLHNFVENRFTENAKFNHDRYRNVVMKAQRLMDDLVDLELEAVDKIINKIENDKEPEDVKAREFNLWKRIKTKAQNGRRTGLGITALGDAIAELGMKYGSDQSINFTSEVYRNHCVSAYKSSCIMAQERGAFPVYDENLEKDNEFLNQVKDEEDIRKLMSIAGRRNIALLTTAPAGSVSIMTQTTSGCEPVFKIQYKRRKKINVGDENTPVDYVDPMGDKWQEFTVSHHGFNEWKRITGLSDDDIEKSPYWGATANDIDWLKKIELQAAAQKWVDHAISNTVNLPENVSVDTVKQIYMKGWETGCKGVTIYREGSRSGVLVSDDTKTVNSSNPEDIELKFQELINKNPEYRPKNILMSPAPKREKELPCDIHRVNVKGESYLVVIGLLNGQPYEIFAGLSAHVEVPKKVKSGILIKNGKNSDGLATYNLKIPFGDDDHIMFKDIVNLFDNPMHGAFTRTLSLSLRHGVKIQHIVEQLRKDKHSDIFSFSSCIARVLSKNYIKDGTSSRETCPSCGGKNLNYQQGCVTCMDCGHSKCG